MRCVARRRLHSAYARDFVLVKFKAAASAPFGTVHGGVGTADESRRVLAVIRVGGNAEARRQSKHVIADRTGCRQDGKNLRGDHSSIRCFGDFAHQHQKFVAAVAANGIRGTHDRLQTACDQLQHFITNRMSERVVDVLELVEVEK